MVSVQYATIVPMTDADIARDNVSRDAYAAIAARRTQFDQLVWQVSVLSTYCSGVPLLNCPLT
jgi:hypothetical protein